MTQTTTPMWTLGDRLRKARESAGLSAGELAAELDVHRNTISGYENDRHTPSRIVLRYIAMRCGVPLGWLTGDPEDAVDQENASTIWSGTTEQEPPPASEQPPAPWTLPLGAALDRAAGLNHRQLAA